MRERRRIARSIDKARSLRYESAIRRSRIY